MRPKSIATVVVVLPSNRLVSSRLAEAVVSGMISDTDPTKVVFPTPKPPAMTIFTGVGARSAWPAVLPAELPGLSPGPGGLDRAESIQHPLKKSEVGAFTGLRRAVHVHQTLIGHVTNQHASDPERQVQPRRDLRDRQDVPAQQRDRAPFEAQ